MRQRITRAGLLWHAALLSAAVGATALAAAPAHGRPGEPITIKIIAFNDYHGNIQSPGTFGVNAMVAPAQRPAVGGADYLAAYVARLKARNALHVVVGAGDFVGASPLVSALFFDEPAVETLNRIGLEFNAVGNHEFDKGTAELKRLQYGGCKRRDGVADPNSCKGLGSHAPGSFDGARFKWLAANVFERATGRTVLPAYAVKSFRGVQVAFIGVTLRGTAQMVPPAGIADVEFRDEAQTVNALIPRLRGQGVHAIVLLVHQGGYQTHPSPGDINGCDGNLKFPDGSASPIAKIVQELDDGVDLVISGHTHAAYNCSANTIDVKEVDGQAVATPRPTGLPNSAGRLVPVTSANAYGRVLSDIDLRVDPRSRSVVAVSPMNLLVDRSDAQINHAIAADPSVRHIVEGYAALAAPLADQVVGAIAAPLPNLPNSAGEMPAGDLVADAHLRATQPAALGGAEMAFVNAGGVRTGFAMPGTGNGLDVSYGNAFMVQPFGNNLVTMTLTSQQLKDLLEQQFRGCMGQTAQRMLQVSNGLRYSWKVSGAPCAKVVDVVLTPTDLGATPPRAVGAPVSIVANGIVQAPDRTFRVTVNNYMASGGDGFGTLLGGTDLVGGMLGVDALIAYFDAAYKPPKAAYDPALPALGIPRISALP